MKRAGKRFPALLLQPYCNPDGAELQHASECRFHRIGGTILHVGQDMGVDVEGDGYGGVAEHLGDHLHVDTLSNWPEESTNGGEETFELVGFSSYEGMDRGRHLEDAGSS
jgi:hypothetical protein